MHKLIAFVVFPFAVLTLVRAAVAQEREDSFENSRVNIVLLLSDDQRTDTIAAHGNPNIRTPHLDSLVERGTSFRRAYCLGARGGRCVHSESCDVAHGQAVPRPRSR